MSDRRCRKCHRLQSQHPGMKFASMDMHCPCVDCQRGRDTTPSGDVGTPQVVDVKAQRVLKSPSPHNRDKG